MACAPLPSQALVPEAILALEEREAALAAVELLREELADREAALEAAQHAQHAEQDAAYAEDMATGLEVVVSLLQVRGQC